MKFAGQDYDDSFRINQFLSNASAGFSSTQYTVQLVPKPNFSHMYFGNAVEYAAPAADSSEEREFHDVLVNFTKALRGHTDHQSDSLDVLDDYVQKCDEILIMKQLELGALHDNLLQERNSWNLLKAIVQENREVDDQRAIMDEDSETPKSLAGEMNKRTSKKDARRKKRILDWLQQAEHEKIAITEQHNISGDLAKGVMWSNTVYKLAQNEGYGFQNRPLVSCIDPDAPSLENRVLDSDDEELEKEFLRTVWMHMRTGNHSPIITLLTQCKQEWRIVSLLDLFTDTDVIEEHTPTFETAYGNRDLWRGICLQLCLEQQQQQQQSDNNNNVHNVHNVHNVPRPVAAVERAIYACLSGKEQGVNFLLQNSPMIGRFGMVWYGMYMCCMYM
jgi:hypothetical protein